MIDDSQAQITWLGIGPKGCSSLANLYLLCVLYAGLCPSGQVLSWVIWGTLLCSHGVLQHRGPVHVPLLSPACLQHSGAVVLHGILIFTHI
jgi:hypothetical protein